MRGFEVYRVELYDNDQLIDTMHLDEPCEELAWDIFLNEWGIKVSDQARLDIELIGFEDEDGNTLTYEQYIEYSLEEEREADK